MKYILKALVVTSFFLGLMLSYAFAFWLIDQSPLWAILGIVLIIGSWTCVAYFTDSVITVDCPHCKAQKDLKVCDMCFRDMKTVQEALKKEEK